MALRVLTASSTAALIALATVKDRLGITDTAQDTQLNQLIAEASSAIVAYLGRDLARQRYEQSTRGDHRRRLLLERFPVDRDSITLTVDGTAATDFAIYDASVGMLSRAIGWPCPSSADDDENNVVATYKAGYVLPDQISTWTAAATATLGKWLRPTSPALSPLLFEITTGGTLHAATEATWPTTAGQTVTNGTAVMTARDAQELPQVLVNCAWLTVQEFRQRLTRLAGATSMSADGFSVSYDLKALDCALPGNVERSLDQWRIQA
jgi:hypothetical protein